MKIYSNITKKFYDYTDEGVEACKAEEKAVKEERAKKAAEEEAKKALAEKKKAEEKARYDEVVAALNNYYTLVNKYIKDYGSFVYKSKTEKDKKADKSEKTGEKDVRVDDFLNFFCNLFNL